MKKLFKGLSDMLVTILLFVILIGGVLAPFLLYYNEFKTLEKRELTYNCVEDTTTLKVVGYKSMRGPSYYYVEDTDGNIGTLNTGILDKSAWRNTYTFGDIVQVDRRRYYHKETGLEELRQYKLDSEEWPEIEYSKGFDNE